MSPACCSVTPNHLDQFTWDEYVGLKRKIFAFQDAGRHRRLQRRRPGLAGAAARGARPRLPLQRRRRPRRGRRLPARTARSTGGATAAPSAVVERDGDAAARLPQRRQRRPAPRRSPPPATSARTPSRPPCAASRRRSTASSSSRSVDGVDYYNDSIATAPERTLAALRSFEEPIVLLLGGRDKNLPLDEMLRRGRRSAAGPSSASASPGRMLAEAAEATGVPVERVDDAGGAPSRPRHACAQAGDVVLLSPACTSFDAYDNFEQRGIEFRRLVQRSWKRRAVTQRRRAACTPAGPTTPSSSPRWRSSSSG